MLRAATGLCWIALCAAAVLMSGTPLIGAEPLYLAPAPQPLGELPPVAPAPLTTESFYAPGPQPTEGPMTLPVAPSSTPAGDCSYGVRYWIVSSRNAPQDYGSIGCGHLDVFERRCDGSLCPSGLAALQTQLQPGAPVMLFLHGSYVSWEDNCVQSDATWCWIRRACPQLPLNVIFFTWPSDRERCLLVPCELKRQGVEAEVNAFYVASLLAYLPDCHPYCLVGHSYGARMVMATLHLAGGGDLHGMRFGGSVGRKRLRAVLAAGALDHNWLNEDGRYCRALCRAECVLNMRNRHDVALKVYPLLRPLMAHRAIGASGVTGLDRRQQPCTCRIHDLDVTSVIGKGHFWPNYYEAPSLARTIAPWVYFPEVNPGYGVMGAPLTQATPSLTTVADPDARRVASASDEPPLAQTDLVQTGTRSPVPPPATAKPSHTATTSPARSPSVTSTQRTSQPSSRTASTTGGLIGWWRSRGE